MCGAGLHALIRYSNVKSIENELNEINSVLKLINFIYFKKCCNNYNWLAYMYYEYADGGWYKKEISKIEYLLSTIDVYLEFTYFRLNKKTPGTTISGTPYFLCKKCDRVIKYQDLILNIKQNKCSCNRCYIFN
jgi:hypothetical protein